MSPEYPTTLPQNAIREPDQNDGGDEAVAGALSYCSGAKGPSAANPISFFAQAPKVRAIDLAAAWKIAFLCSAAAWLALLGLAPKLTVEKAPILRPPRVEEFALAPGENLSVALARAGIDPPTIAAITEAYRSLIDPRRIRAGAEFKLFFEPGGERPWRLEQRLEGGRLDLKAGPEGWSAERKEIPFALDSRVVRGVLAKNLYRDGTGAGLSPTQILGLSDIFQYEIDFFSDFRSGDLFAVAFNEAIYADGRRQAGEIFAAELEVGGERRHAFRYVGKDGEEGYFDWDGRSLRRAFLRSPLQYRRISSTFTDKRYHPILRTVHAHLGIDYAAAPGTPVVAVGRGTVTFAGWNGGYGKFVELRHGNGYSTRYAHLSRIAAQVSPGAKVAQGQVLGHVGQTGLATGPHLHFEILRGGKQIDFLALRMPADKQLTGGELAEFAALRNRHAMLLRGQAENLAKDLEQRPKKSTVGIVANAPLGALKYLNRSRDSA